MAKRVPIPQNYKKSVDWIIQNYTDSGVTFPNGFQKDAIQNATGARPGNKWKDWHCDLSLVSNKKGTFLVIEDSGTVGLTGSNTSTDEINHMLANNETLEKTERLSRFTSMFNSGDNDKGPGLYGAGKTVYSAASDDYTYYFDSLREDGLYVANYNEKGEVRSLAYENSEAIDFIAEQTGLPEKTTVGTRIIIHNPKQELIDSIASGELVKYIQESWWLIIQRLDETAAITVNGKKVELPEGFKDTPYKFELANPEIFANGYKVKHFGLYVFEDGNNDWKDISYYRKGMKIGDIEIKDSDLAPKLSGKYWGYIEVEEEWEAELASIEDAVHFGVSKGKKGTNAYQYLKKYCSEKIKDNFIKWGFIKDKESEDKRLNDELKQIAEDIQDLFERLGMEDLGKGAKRPDFDVRWQDIQYPEEDNETVTTGDEISFSARFTSHYATDKKMEYKLSVIEPSSGTIISTIREGKMILLANQFTVKDFVVEINESSALRYAENRICLLVKVIGSGKDKRKELPFFYDIDKPVTDRDNVRLDLHEISFPNEQSRRVNFNESIKDISYRIDNHRNCTLSYRLNVSVHNASDPTCPKIKDVVSLTGVLAPFEETITPRIDLVNFPEDEFAPFLESGILELRARLVATENDFQYEKGDKITNYHYKIYLNCDEKNGKSDAFIVKSIDDKENYKRSWAEPGSTRVICLNVGHAAYLSIKDYPDLQHAYLREQMLKQYVLLYLAEGKYDMFGSDGKDFLDLEPQDAADSVIEKIEKIYSQSLR